MSAEVVTRSAVVVATESSETFRCFAVALPGCSGSLLDAWSTGRSVMIVTDTYFRIWPVCAIRMRWTP